jgi:hypothetical protein
LEPATPRVHSVYRRLQPEQIAELVADYEAGFRVAALMRRFELGKGTVLGILRDHGVKLRNQGLSPSDLPQAIARYEAGESLAGVGRAFGCDANVIRRHLVAAGVTIRACSGLTPGRRLD